MKYKIGIVSAGRAGTDGTWGKMGDGVEATIFVPPEEREEYQTRTGREAVGVKGTLCDTRNAIFEWAGRGNWVLMLDDDIQKVGRFAVKNGVAKKQELSWGSWLKELERLVLIARLAGIDTIGVALTPNAFYYHKPFNLHGFIMATVQLTRVTDLKFNTKYTTKEDYDYTMASFRRDGAVLRADYLWQEAKHRTNAGGSKEYRSRELEEGVIEMMMKDWPGWVRRNPRRDREVLLTLPQASEEKRMAVERLTGRKLKPRNGGRKKC